MQQIKNKIIHRKMVPLDIKHYLMEPKTWIQKILYKLCFKFKMIEDSVLKIEMSEYKDLTIDDRQQLDTAIQNIIKYQQNPDIVILAGYEWNNNMTSQMIFDSTYNQIFGLNNHRTIIQTYRNIPIIPVEYISGAIAVNRKDIFGQNTYNNTTEVN